MYRTVQRILGLNGFTKKNQKPVQRIFGLNRFTGPALRAGKVQLLSGINGFTKKKIQSEYSGLTESTDLQKKSKKSTADFWSKRIYKKNKTPKQKRPKLKNQKSKTKAWRGEAPPCCCGCHASSCHGSQPARSPACRPTHHRGAHEGCRFSD